ncbi:DUF7133 domain-containing protein [Algoriphagus winogradskyi]|uniref:Cytochrome C oxidase, cbb3-type, subunit III n=1 Tax=Algoriphagus winogradskyi TaxID=237017 RepID=A0ABY1NZZ5_9BACT|nr:c-type cytochrome [Algoriphagus winogradskyi]SMP21542.1 Cytochrome C oxidase, cbb3-type, subunit III [Algoriphagus winogradskyi]
MSIIRIASSFLIAITLFSCSKSVQEDPSNPSPAQSAEEELETFQLEEGFQIQLVAAEPMVEDPVFITFDEDSRLWVIEMRGFMTDTLGSEEDKPIGRISVLEDEDGDGVMDKSTIYLDSLIMPRALGFFADGVLVSENTALWVTKDLDGDLKADTKVSLDSTYASSGNPEHSDNGLLRNVDNWYYNAKSRLRYKYQDGEWIRDTTEFRGQWGISHDDQGRLFYNYNWSPLHVDLVPPNYLSRNPNHSPTIGIDYGVSMERSVFPIRQTPAVNRGYIPGVLSDDQRLMEFTAACSPWIYRAGLFPQEYYGNAFVAEPAGNLVKRNIISQTGNVLEGKDPHSGVEFLASTDERFRPVDFATGPDGALYIADMYRGLIQHGEYLTPYLREQTIGRGLEMPVHLGRIWKIVPKGKSKVVQPKLSKNSNDELIAFLSNSDGWYRDMAQRLLVERNDTSVKAKLMELVADSKSTELGRFHALWTLEGLNLLSADFLLSIFENSSGLIQSTALRLLEPFALQSNATKVRLTEAMEKVADSSTSQEALQLSLSSYVLESSEYEHVLSVIFTKYGDDPLIRDAMMSSLGGREYDFLQKLWQSEDWKVKGQTKEIFLETLASAIIKNGDQKEVKGLLALADEKELGWKENILISGMSIQAASLKDRKPILLSSEPSFFNRTDLPIDQSRVEMLKRMFAWPGYTPSEVKLVANQLDEKALEQFADGRQKFLVTCAGCHGSDGAGAPRMGPPLVGSEWVLGNEARLAMILLHGLEGPVEVAGKTYDAPDILPVMPAHSTMDDGSIAAILTYIRNEWGNKASPISSRTIGKTRVSTQGRVYPWKADELDEYIESLPPVEAPNP